MRFRFGLIIGFAAGYVLGAKAGRDRYHQILNAFDKMRSNESVKKVADTTERATRTPRALAGDGMIRVARTIRVKADQRPNQPDSR